MRHDFRISPGLEQIAAAAALDAERHDQDGSFPTQAFEALGAMGVTKRLPLGRGEAMDLLWILAAAGRGDLSVGRILEGHVNVLVLIDRYGSETQRSVSRALLDEGALFGVWNTDAPGNPLCEAEGALQGAKSFSTGIDGLSHAIVTTTVDGARQMLLVPLAGRPVDRTWWRPLGMKASGSHVVDFTGHRIDAGSRLGGPDAYIQQPWFSAGAMRFAAVQVGGMHGVLDTAVQHLQAARRTEDPYQRHRVGVMATAVEGGYGWLRRCAESWTRCETGGAAEAEEAIATVNAARGAVERACLEVLELAERSVGAAGFIAPHPLERRLRDLRTYLRQPNPDGALASFGDSVIDGAWSPGRRSDPDIG
ncbi:MAG: acyl-CoA dehydrogenase family protein [Phenylobacterium sp.]|nr:acyl-CoA dehydrogenase family protein [Phenylobacterium sp.]